MNDQDKVLYVCYTWNGKRYHRAEWVTSVSTGKQYVRSACGLLNSATWNITVGPLEPDFVFGYTPCHKCFPF